MPRFFLCLLGALATMFASATTPAAAGQAFLIIDARSGRILQASNADTPNRPASLTKMMTLYLAFEALHADKLSWDDRLPVSRNATSKVPYKLGVGAGGSITLREAVMGMIVLSANDAAVAVAEKLGGSEEGFARLMTARARQLGMRSTTFRNSTGLTATGHMTTARDMSTLGLALMRDFPQEYKLFSTQSFSFRGKALKGHNFLVQQYPGADGIKTGYTSASGYNVVTSAVRGNRRLLGVVMGDQTAGSRDRRMSDLLDRSFGETPALSATGGMSGKPLAPGLF